MGGLFEILFESVSRSSVFPLLVALLHGTEQIESFFCSENFTMDIAGGLSEEALNQILDFDGDICMSLFMNSLKLDGIVLPNVQIRLIKYGTEFDIEYNFDENELHNSSVPLLINRLHEHAKRLSIEFNVSNYYGGLESALDEDTRYFTNEEKGPLY